MQDRHDLTDVQWALLEPLLPERAPRRGGRWRDHRPVVDGVLWRTRTGCPWRDLPAAYGPWQTVDDRHRRCSADGTLAQVLDALRIGVDAQSDPEAEWVVSIDSTIVRAHQHAAGARRAAPRDVDPGRLIPVVPLGPPRRGLAGGPAKPGGPGGRQP